MSIDLLFADFDRLIQSPNLFIACAASFLTLAVRGKLVPQDPNDEPASELLKRITAEKARLVKAGEIRKPKHQILAGNPEIDFLTPANGQLPKLGHGVEIGRWVQSPQGSIQ